MNIQPHFLVGWMGAANPAAQTPGFTQPALLSNGQPVVSTTTLVMPTAMQQQQQPPITTSVPTSVQQLKQQQLFPATAVSFPAAASSPLNYAQILYSPQQQQLIQLHQQQQQLILPTAAGHGAAGADPAALLALQQQAQQKFLIPSGIKDLNGPTQSQSSSPNQPNQSTNSANSISSTSQIQSTSSSTTNSGTLPVVSVCTTPQPQPNNPNSFAACLAAAAASQQQQRQQQQQQLAVQQLQAAQLAQAQATAAALASLQQNGQFNSRPNGAVLPAAALGHTQQQQLQAAQLAAQLAAAAAVGIPTGGGIAGKYSEKRKLIEELAMADVKKAKLETKALKAKRPGFTDDRYNETAYYVENGLRKVYPYYFTFTTFTKGRWVGEKILEVFGREFRAHPVEEYKQCIINGTLTVNYDQVDVDYRLRHNDLLANIVHRHETPVLSKPIEVIHLSEELVVLDKPCSLPVHPCGRYRHNTVVFILAKEYNLKNLRTIHRLDRLTSGLLMFGRNPKKAREMEQQIRNRQVLKEYVCRVEGEFPEGSTECCEPVEVVSYKIGVCKVSPHGKECKTEFERLSFNGKSSVVLCRPFTGRMHQIRVHLQYLGFPVINDPLYNHDVFGPNKGKGGIQGKSDDQLIQDLIAIHNAENWLGMDGDEGLSMFNKDDAKGDKQNGDQEINGGSGANNKQKKNNRDLNIRSNNNKDVSALNNNNNTITKNNAINNSKMQQNGTSHNKRHTSEDESGWQFNPLNPMESLERNPNVPRNCAITRPPPITKPGASAMVIRPPLDSESNEPITEQDNELLSQHQEYRYQPEKMTWDPICYECKVRYRDPKAGDLVMYLHAWRYKGPNWQFQTRLPDWAEENWEGPLQLRKS